MPSEPNPKLLFVDLETTGLDPDTDTILEVGAWAVSPLALDMVGSFHWLVDYNVSDIKHFERELSEDVRRMHTESGLLKALVEASGTQRALPIDDIDINFADWMDRYYYKVPKPWLAGRNPAFDRAFMQRYMPRSFDLLHYRSLDVTALRWLTNVTDFPYSMPQDRRNHRALDDVEDAVKYARQLVHYLNNSGNWVM